MKTKTIFEKNYTRDTTLIIQELWLLAHENGIYKRLQIKCEYLPFGIDYMNNGAIEIWENSKSLKYIKDELIKKTYSDKKKILNLLKNFEKEHEFLEKFWKKGSTSKKEELIKIINKIDDLMVCNLIYSYLGINDKTEKEIYLLSKKLREKDHFFVNNDMFIRESIRKIFPELSDYPTCVTLSEIKGKLPSLSLCKKRFENFISTPNYKAVEKLEKYAEKNPEQIFYKEKITESLSKTGIKGQTAQKGKITGIAKIISLKSQINKIEVGDIIISPMTTAAMIPAINKASAIVTDEGGILCHAAIVAREMKKPCVIATKVATSIFKDGDYIEVDANKGIVRKLN